jgi:hypothetical protein
MIASSMAESGVPTVARSGSVKTMERGVERSCRVTFGQLAAFDPAMAPSSFASWRTGPVMIRIADEY